MFADELSRYVGNLLKVYRVVSADREYLGRAASGEADALLIGIVDTFNSAPMVGLDDKSITFSDLTDEAKNTYLQAWADETVNLMSASIVNPAHEASTAQSLQKINEALEESGLVDDSNQRSLGDRAKAYLRISRTELTRSPSYSAIPRGGSSEPDGPFLLDPQARDFILRHWREGYILTGFGGGDLNPAHNAGHDSIMGALNLVSRKRQIS